MTKPIMLVMQPDGYSYVNVVDTKNLLLSSWRCQCLHWCVQAFTDAGVSATDSLDGNLTASVQVIGDVNTSHPGIYTLTYRVSDQVGNQAIDVQRQLLFSINHQLGSL